jgi:hypothetical protein
MTFEFLAGNIFELNILDNTDEFIAHFSDFQTVELNNEQELELLFDLMNIHNPIPYDIATIYFEKYWDISAYKLPELDTLQFDEFYESWLQKSNRQNNMDEYGSLIFLQGLSKKWNQLKFRIVIKYKDE